MKYRKEMTPEEKKERLNRKIGETTVRIDSLKAVAEVMKGWSDPIGREFTIKLLNGEIFNLNSCVVVLKHNLRLLDNLDLTM